MILLDLSREWKHRDQRLVIRSSFIAIPLCFLNLELRGNVNDDRRMNALQLLKNGRPEFPRRNRLRFTRSGNCVDHAFLIPDDDEHVVW
jgi:hypothetical protein